MTEYVCIAVPHIEMDTSLIHTDYLPRERVVRCRDCKHAITSYRDGLPRCAGPLVMEATLVSPDGFCAWGSTGEGES